MSQANVEAFKRAFDAINRRDAEALLLELDPNVEWHGAILIAMGGDRTVYRGHEGVRDWLRDLYETLSEFHADYPDIRDLGDRVVAIGVVRGRGSASEAEIESPHGTVAEFKDAKGIRVRTYLDPKEALEAAGVQE
jgi:ketosteroid isomerase-like protein